MELRQKLLTKLVSECAAKALPRVLQPLCAPFLTPDPICLIHASVQMASFSGDDLGMWVFFFGGEVVTSRYFHCKAVLSTLDQLGKTKTHTQGNLQKTRHTRPSSKKKLFFSKHTDMATAAHIGYSIMHSRLRQPAVSTPRAHGSNLQAGLNTIVYSCITASTTPFEPTRKAEPTWWQPQVPLSQFLTRLLRLLLMGLPYAVGKLGMA
jgi:hypothetical protein